MTDLPFLFDTGPVAALQRLLGLGWPDPWRVITLLGTNWGLLLVLGLALWLWGRRAAYSVLAVVAVDAVLKMALNLVFKVPRPQGPELVKYERVNVGSFPSGHLSTAASLWGWLAVRGRVGWLLAGTLIVLVAISRLYLGVHYVGDILGGLVLAAVVIALVYWLYPRVHAALARVPFWGWVVASLLAIAGVVAGTMMFFGSNPYRWRAGGLVLGLAIALPLEYRFVRYAPGDGSTGRKVLMVLIGAVGIAVFAGVDQITGELSNSLGFASTALAAIWTVLVAPTLFSVLGWSERGEPRREETVGRTARGLGIATAVLAGIVAWGGIVEPRMILDTEDRNAAVPGLPQSWDGATVGILADFQVGLWLDNTGMMHRAVDALVERKPAAAILAGDFIYHPHKGAEQRVRTVMEILRPLAESGIPTYAVLGNHDWGLPRPVSEADANPGAARMLKDSLEAAGITVLQNRFVALPSPDGSAASGPLYLVGIGARYMELDRPELALEGLPESAARLAVMHNPSSFPEFPAHAAPVAVAGHTHGGQFRLPLTPEWSWLNYFEGDDFHADGWAEDDFGAAGNRLYVTRGIGMSLLPMRLNCPPELTFLTLRAGSSGSSGSSGSGEGAGEAGVSSRSGAGSPGA